MGTDTERRPPFRLNDDELHLAWGGWGPRFDLMRWALGVNIAKHQDHFLAKTISTDYTTSNSGAASAAAAQVSDGVAGEMLMDAGTADDGYSRWAWDLNFRAQENPVFMARLKLNTATLVKVEMGWTDVETDAGAVLVLATPTATAADAALLVVDTDDTANWQGFGVKAGTLATKGEPGTAPTTSYTELAVALWETDAIMYINGVEYTRVASAITATTKLTPWLFVQNRSASQRTLTVDYVAFGQVIA